MLKHRQVVRIKDTNTVFDDRFGRIVGLYRDPSIGPVYLIESWYGDRWTEEYPYPVVSVSSANLEIFGEKRFEVPEDCLFGNNEHLFDDDAGSDDGEIL